MPVQSCGIDVGSESLINSAFALAPPLGDAHILTATRSTACQCRVSNQPITWQRRALACRRGRDDLLKFKPSIRIEKNEWNDWTFAWLLVQTGWSPCFRSRWSSVISHTTISRVWKRERSSERQDTGWEWPDEFKQIRKATVTQSLATSTLRLRFAQPHQNPGTDSGKCCLDWWDGISAVTFG